MQTNGLNTPPPAPPPPSAPPLPPGPPPHVPLPPAAHAMAVSALLMHPQPPPPPAHAQGLPPITEMLYREGNAWAALLSLHGGVLASAKHASTASDGDSTLSSKREQVEMREAAYCSTLTNLASQADALASEALKLRQLRRLRASEEVKVIAAMPLVQEHSIETMAVGGTLAGNSAMSVQAAAADIRQAHNTTRSQLAQLHALLGVIGEAREVTGHGLRLALGINERAVPLDTVLKEVYKHSASITPEALARALQDLSVGEPTALPAAAPPQRSVARRHGPDRAPAGGATATAAKSHTNT